MKKIIFFLFICMAAYYASAASITSNELSSKNFQTSENTLFNSAFSNPNKYSINTLGTQSQIPLIYDLGHDGNNELLIPSDNHIFIYGSYQLASTDLIHTLTPSNVTKFLKIKIYEYLGETYLIGLSQKSNTHPLLSKWVWNSSQGNFSFINSITPSSLTGVASVRSADFICDTTNGVCYVGYFKVSTPSLFIGAFNITKTSSLEDTTQTATASGFVAVFGDVLCEPQGQFMILSDLDNDGSNELLLSAVDFNAATGYFKPSYAIMRYNLAGNLFTIISGSKFYQSSAIGPMKLGLNPIAADDCLWVSSYFAAPIQGNFISGGDGKEIALAFDISSNAFNSFVYRYDHDSKLMSQYDFHPHLSDIILGIEHSGPYLSNMVQLKSFTYDTNPNYCVMGFSDTNKTTLFCATNFYIPLTGFNARSFSTENLSNPHDVSANNSKYIYSIRPTTNDGLDGVLTPFGTYSLENGGISSDLLLQFAISDQNGLVSPSNFKNTGNDDIMLSSFTNVIYYDDKNANDNAYISTALQLNPCLPQRFNQTVSVTYKVADTEGNLINTRAFAYYGTQYQQNGTVMSNLTSGSLITYEFNTTVSGNNFIYRVEAQDTLPDHNSNWNIKTETYYVSLDGYLFGECQTELTPITEITQATAPESNYTNKNNLVRTQIISLAEGVGLTSSLFILILIAGISVILFIAGMQNETLSHHAGTFGLMIFFIDFVILIVAGLMGLINTAILVTLILVLLLVVSGGIVMLWKKLSGG